MNKKQEGLFPYQILDINDLEGEEWKDIDDYPNYQVSNLGRIKSLNYHRTGEPQIIKQALSNKGYLLVGLSKDGKRKLFSSHRLVSLAFIDNPNNLPVINHKDENPTNNCVENLEWCTYEYNNNYGTHNEKISKTLKGRKFLQEHNDKISIALKGKKHSQEHIDKIAKAKSIAIVQIDPITKTGRKWESAAQAEREGEFNQGAIIKCCKNKYSTKSPNIYKGYEWSYFSLPVVIN